MGNKDSSPLEIYLEDLPDGVLVSEYVLDETKLLKFKLGSVIAVVGCGFTNSNRREKLWSTVYRIETKNVNMNYEEVAKLLLILRDYYLLHGYDFGYSCAENTKIKSILYKGQIKQREQGILSV